ncbi:MAG: YncE family protein [Alphaproteobacteria bacterium]|nr:YncE family protein [Alphaproteobacteria bacterium]
MNNRLAVAALLGLILSPAAADSSRPLYSVEKAIPLGPGERWDYVTYDPVDRRAYVAHGDHVTVVDVEKSTTIGDIGPLPGGTHGIAISHATGEGFTDDGAAGTVAVFDLATLKIRKTIPAAPDADGIVLDLASGHIFVIDGDSGVVTVIDPKTDAAIATIKVGAALEAGDADGRGHLYVDGAEQHDIVAIDTRTNAVIGHWPMPACERPHGIAIDSRHRRVFASCVNKVMTVVDADSGAVLASLPIGGFTDGAAFDPVRGRAFSANGDGTVSVIAGKAGQGFVALDEVKTVPSARTMAIDEKSGRLFLPAADITKVEPPKTPGGRMHVEFAPGSLRLLVLEPRG